MKLRSFAKGLRLVVVGFLVTLGVACGVATDSTPQRLDPSLDTVIKVAVSTTAAADPDQSIAATTVPEAVEQRPVVVYLAQGEGLVPRARSLPEPVSPEMVVGLLQRGPTESEIAAGMRSMFTADGQVVAVSDIIDGNVLVDLDPSILELTGSDQLLLVGQLTLTLTSLTAVSSVRFSVQEGPISVVGPDGGSLDRPVTKADFGPLIFR